MEWRLFLHFPGFFFLAQPIDFDGFSFATLCGAYNFSKISGIRILNLMLLLTIIQTAFWVTLLHFRIQNVSFLLVAKKSQKFDLGLLDLTEFLFLLDLTLEWLALGLFHLFGVLIETSWKSWFLDASRLEWFELIVAHVEHGSVWSCFHWLLNFRLAYWFKTFANRAYWLDW